MVDRQNIDVENRGYGYAGGREYGDFQRGDSRVGEARSRLYDTAESEVSPYQRIAERYSRSEPSLYEREAERDYGRTRDYRDRDYQNYPPRAYADRPEPMTREREREREREYRDRDYEERPAPRYIDREPVRAPAKAPARAEKRGEELMPSIHTMKYLNGQEKERQERAGAKEGAKPAGKLDTRAKVMIALYAAIVLVLVITIIVTGVSVSNMGSGVSALQRDVSAQQARIIQQNTQLEGLTGNAELWAEANDMVADDGSQAKVVVLEPLPASYGNEHSTNAFDGFLDWISSLLGID